MRQANLSSKKGLHVSRLRNFILQQMGHGGLEFHSRIQEDPNWSEHMNKRIEKLIETFHTIKGNLDTKPYAKEKCQKKIRCAFCQ